MTTVVISQPMYFPWPGFLAQLAIADVVVWTLLDAPDYLTATTIEVSGGL